VSLWESEVAIGTTAQLRHTAVVRPAWAVQLSHLDYVGRDTVSLAPIRHARLDDSRGDRASEVMPPG
jgi:hypothetical protein